MSRVPRTLWVAWACLAAAVAIAAGCSSTVPSVPPATPAIGTPLPTTAFQPPQSGTPGPCAGVGLDAILHGDPSDPGLTWIVDRGSGLRTEALWPAGFSARFDPSLEVLDASGRVVHHEGDLIDGGCVTGDDRQILLGYP